MASLFSHFARIPPPSAGAFFEKGMCKRFLEGKCPFSALACSYSHNKDQAPLCSRWKEGRCIGATGNKCLYRHYYLERDAAPGPAARQPLAVLQGQADSFNSPYRVKVVKERLQHRREEVDLETGKRRSWVEEEEREVMDLTGETPAKPKMPKPVPVAKPRLAAGSLLVSTFPSRDPTTTAPTTTTPTTTAPAPEPATTDPGTCPVCGRTGFAGVRGVRGHRAAKNSKCKEGTVAPPAAPGIQRGTVAAQEEVIVIPDTPEVPSPLETPSLRRRKSRSSLRNMYVN